MLRVQFLALPLQSTINEVAYVPDIYFLTVLETYIEASRNREAMLP